VGIVMMNLAARSGFDAEGYHPDDSGLGRQP
jgi:hypothetical protein